MKNEKELKELREELKLLRSLRKEKHLPTIWVSKDNKAIEIHFENKTILAKVTTIDKQTSREDSYYMAKGSGYKQLNYMTIKEDDN